MSEKHEHEGSFAEGDEETEHHPEDEKRDFAEGVEEEREHRHEGSFAEGRRGRRAPPRGRKEGRLRRRDRRRGLGDGPGGLSGRRAPPR